MKPTEEQLSIVAYIQGTQGNVLVNALAGTGKTSTLQLIEDSAKEDPLIYLAFNKANAAEARDKFTRSTTVAKTFNSLGDGIWRHTTGRHSLDPKKTQVIFNELLKEFPSKDAKDIREVYWDIIQGVGLAKSLGYVPDRKFPQARRLIDRGAFHAALETKPSPLTADLIDSILFQSIKLAYEGTIDFNDQIYMPALFGGTFPRFPLVLVDEAQDLSPANHAMLDKLCRGRICAVGDRWQSIYGFRGAVREGVDRLRDKFNLQEQGLTVSFRCPKTIVEAARWRVPHFKWIKPGGHYEVLHRLSHHEIPEGAAIICRNN